MLKQFKRSMVDFLRNRHFDYFKDFDPEAMHNYVSAGVEQAKRYGLTKRGEVRAFFGFLVSYGTEFGINEESSWAANILNRDNLTSSEKIQFLDQADLKQQRENIK